MSTRALIARTTETGWEGIYHHWDGYPSGLGATLFHLYHGHFKRDLNRMLAFLLDEHRGGWSTINGQDFTKPAGFGSAGPQCYCHGERSEGPFDLIQSTGQDFAGAEYCYVLDAQNRTMTVLERTWSDGTRAILFFGMDAIDAHWKALATIDLDGDEPDWERL